MQLANKVCSGWRTIHLTQNINAQSAPVQSQTQAPAPVQDIYVRGVSADSMYSGQQLIDIINEGIKRQADSWGWRMIEIYIPKAYSIIGDPSLTATLSSLQTYKSAQVSGTKALPAALSARMAKGLACLLTRSVRACAAKIKCLVGINDKSDQCVLNGRANPLRPAPNTSFRPRKTRGPRSNLTSKLNTTIT